MEFTTPVSVANAIQILRRHHQEVPVLADTVVEIGIDYSETRYEFSVKRRWKGKRGWVKYSVVELNGTLTELSKESTAVNAQLQLGIMAYVILAFVILLPLIGSGSRDSALFWLVSIMLAGLCLFDAYVLYRVINSLKKGILYW